jgi:Tol biopolymer transport system component
MGEVYKATDTRLNRTVAIKVLPPHFSDDPEMTQRFEREAKTVASLNHPNICTLHDIGREAETDFLVMEYLEGETLAQHISRGALALDEALNVAIAVLDALDKAHAQGVVHRDLKPSNIMLSANGVKLLDFGLAKWKAPVQPVTPPAAKVARAPRPDATAPGMIVGTLQYMAPEQLEGAEADARTDIFAFGSIFYEMVTGKKAFEGKNQPLLIAAILTLDLDPLSKMQPDSPAALDHVIKRCLAKDPDDRWQTAHDLLIQLRWITEGGGAAILPASVRRRERLIRLALAAAVLLAAVLAAPAYFYFRGPTQQDEFRFRIPVTGLNDSDIALSPDGRTVALVAKPNTQEAASLFVRSVDETTFRKLGGTDDSSQPFWSPDSRSIAFSMGGRLKKVDASGGAPKDLGPAPSFAGGAWNRDGVILFGSEKGIYRVSAEGGAAQLITTVEKTESGHFWPYFLPDGSHYLYLAWSGDAANRAVFAGALGSKDKIKVLAAESNAAYAAPGYLVFHRDATLFAQPFNANKLKPTGDPVHIADQVAFSPTNGRGNFDVSQNEALLYFQSQGGANAPSGRGQTVANSQFGWLDRKRIPIARAGEEGTYGDMDLSPDGKLIAVTRQDGGAADIWVIDWERNGRTWRLTLDPSDDINPVWSQPNGDRVAFTTFRKGNADIYIKNANGLGEETPLLDSPNNEFIEDWSKDGRYIAYKLAKDAYEDIYVHQLTRDGKPEGKPIPVVVGPFHKDEPQFSYDGKWLAYASEESGKWEVYVVSFPDQTQKIKVSSAGGGQPRWRGDGRELFYKAGNDPMAVDITYPAGRITAGIPHMLFPGLNSASSSNPTRHQWAVSSDGQRILMRVPAGGATATVQTTGGPAVTPNSNFTFNGVGGQATAGQGGQGFVSDGLTVVRQWTAAFRNQKQANEEAK